ncbi:D-aminoacid aminotransferase-like PLP-dependent enzymes superfamily protein [Abeliophyllum distichum]|uniref:D-aminoacid aminotransferase-like PLP-dependent enzymes superfamily protein n=1 Tax=Abeliophyllum distichum TaxID=126358 RepID=A0ABD1NVQ8_9LAMI
MSHGNRFLFTNGVVSSSPDTPPVTALLEAHPGAYTKTRTHNNGSELLFWGRHLTRLSNSAKILLSASPKLLFENPEKYGVLFSKFLTRSVKWDSVIEVLVNDSMTKAMPTVLKERKCGVELAITALVSGNLENLSDFGGEFDEERICEVLDVYLHVAGYVPPLFGVQGNGARLAVVGPGRDVANAKYSDWVRLRKPLEKLRPPSITELLLSNDGDRILEGCLTNFFVICLKGNDGDNNFAEQKGLQTFRSVEIQTAPVGDGVLPGVIRQIITQICLKIGIPIREVAPSWSHRELWVEAFVTNSLRVIQHVDTIQVPNSWESVESKTWQEITWVEKRFKDGPGRITSIIQREIMERAEIEKFPVASLNS